MGSKDGVIYIPDMEDHIAGRYVGLYSVKERHAGLG